MRPQKVKPRKPKPGKPRPLTAEEKAFLKTIPDPDLRGIAARLFNTPHSKIRDPR